MALPGWKLKLGLRKLFLQSNVYSTSLRTLATESSTLRKEQINPNAQTSVDIDDVARHTKILNDWWNPHGSMKALHSMNFIRVPLIRDGLVPPVKERTMKPLKSLKLLDVGCGGGILTEALSRLGADVTGLDAGKELTELAKTHSEQNSKLDIKPSYICTSIEDHAKSHKEHYDGVIASEVIEHVNNQEVFVKSCVQTLKPGGRIFFTTPSKTRLAQLLGICMAEYVLNVVPKGTHQYEKFITSNELSLWLERSNCYVELTYGMFYNPLQNKWKFIESQNLMFALQAVKLKD